MKLSRRRAASLYQQSPDRRRPTKRLRAAQAAFVWALLQNPTATFAADGQFWPEIQVNYRLDPRTVMDGRYKFTRYFGPVYRNDYGYQQAKKGYRWRKTPPGL
jgi:hypothetical protein